jgi:hypothetical protein
MRLRDSAASGQRMYPGWSEARAIAWAEAAPKHSLLSFKSCLKTALYEHVPSSYILCEDDAIIPPSKQEEYVGNLESGARTKPDLLRIPTGHVPNLTAVDTLAETLHSIIER